jgi:predicted double-glycine peptidase
MNPWVESLAVLLLAVGGVLLGAWFSRLTRPWWLLGYFIPLSLVILYAIATHRPALGFYPPISWMMLGRNKFAVIGFIGSMVLTTPLLKLPLFRDRLAVSVLMIGVVLLTSVWPFLAPAFNQQFLAGLTTKIDSDGVCLQSTDYTCGPASAVTALQKLGFKADEGEIALLAHTSSATGTPPDILAKALQNRYRSEGLKSEYRIFNDVSELKTCLPTLVVIKFSFMLDHYVTVLDVTDQEITVGDPLSGLRKLSTAEFNDRWRLTGVVLARKH